ncbi:hypothetical protein [Psychrobacter sp. M13]|uniref:hypothetical protein n=1 Tax=Psychrobacter sp. M13 TaxID=3067275 RepID=UPI00273BB1FB|nr:hypothetical protein [Psychrobacter sp. M13]WLP93792.1 hypothetical protein Q9G97_09335 [Psychrobacter sp. M13]
MTKTIYVVLVLFASTLLTTGCQTTSVPSAYSEAELGAGLFFSYPPQDPQTPITASATSATLLYQDGCLLAYNGTYIMNPIFEHGTTTFDLNNHELTIDGKAFQIGDIIEGGGTVGKILKSDEASFFVTKPLNRCIQENIIYFFSVDE